ncbi:MAG: hypothetical protein IT438_10090 [Phycisphaerales bacterium]|nr:hypothetical protein [Phycisphaerales bacterium]
MAMGDGCTAERVIEAWRGRRLTERQASQSRFVAEDAGLLPDGVVTKLMQTSTSDSRSAEQFERRARAPRRRLGEPPYLGARWRGMRG